MAVSESQLKKMMSKYKYRDLTVRQTVNVIAMYKDLKPVLDSYVFNDGSSRELVNLTGTIPVRYRATVRVAGTYSDHDCDIWRGASSVLPTYRFCILPTVHSSRATKHLLLAKHAKWNLCISIWIPSQPQWLSWLSLPTCWPIPCHNKLTVPFPASCDHCWSQQRWHNQRGHYSSISHLSSQ